MGFAIERVLVRGRPTPDQLEGWVRLALPRLRQPTIQYPMEPAPRPLKTSFALFASEPPNAQNAAHTLLWVGGTEPKPKRAEPDRSLMSFALLWKLLGLTRSDSWPSLPEAPTLPALPSDAAGADASSRDAFLLSLALVAKAQGSDAAFLADGSISDSGCLIIPGQVSLAWSEKTCDARRAQASRHLKTHLGADSPDVDTLDWEAPGEPFWTRRLVQDGKRLANG